MSGDNHHDNEVYDEQRCRVHGKLIVAADYGGYKEPSTYYAERSTEHQRPLAYDHALH